MANDVSNRGVLVLDTAADAIVAATTDVHVYAVRLVSAAAAATATLCKSGGTVGTIGLACAISDSDTVWFDTPLKLAGLRLLSLTGAAAIVYVYTRPSS